MPGEVASPSAAGAASPREREATADAAEAGPLEATSSGEQEAVACAVEASGPEATKPSEQEARAGAVEEECPICFHMRRDVEQLKHYGGQSPSRSRSGLDVSQHRACSHCRQQLLEKNQSCPWCRERMEWQDLFGFLDGLKDAIGKANVPDELADLISTWEEYELTRSLADVRAFARDMVEDVGLCAHLDRVLAAKNVAFVRDSAGLWCRFHAMIVDGELEVHGSDAERLKCVVETAMEAFEADGGGAPQHVGAMYTQLAVAVLCAQHSSSSTATLVRLTRRVGEACARLHKDRYKNAGGVRERLPRDFVTAVSDLVWGGEEGDIVLSTFFGPGDDLSGVQFAGFPPDGFPNLGMLAFGVGAEGILGGGGHHIEGLGEQQQATATTVQPPEAPDEDVADGSGGMGGEVGAEDVVAQSMPPPRPPQ